MKLTKEHIGKKMRRSTWDKGCFFTPLAQTSNGEWVGEDDQGSGIFWTNNKTWEFYEEHEPEIELWSVWENPEVGDLLFITKIEAEWFDYFFPDGFVARTNNISEIEFNFLKIYKPRPDLEVVAPSIFSEISSDGHNIGETEYIFNSYYSSQEDFKKTQDLWLEVGVNRKVHKWPASLALCQIVEKKK